MGIDIFFAISGFLITGLLYKSITAGTFSYTNFWERRVRRLVPVLIVLTGFVAIVSPLVLLPEDLKDLGGSLVAGPVLLSNVYFLRVIEGGYFADQPETRPLLHTWTLGVEEQFYLLLPISLALLYRFFPRRLGGILIAVCAFSFALSVWLTSSYESFAYLTLPSRAWEFLMGGLLVIWLQARGGGLPFSQRSREAMAWTGAAMIAGAVLCYHPGMRLSGSAAMLPCLGTILILLANASEPLTSVGRLLGHPWAVRTGQISYSIYLWHWPLVAWSLYLGLLVSPASKILICLLVYLVSYASWSWIETPIRSRRVLPQRRAMMGVYAVYVLVSITFGQLYVAKEGFPQFWPQAASETIALPVARMIDLQAQDPQVPTLGSPRTGPGGFLLWGDCHAMSLALLLHRLGQEYHQSGLQLIKGAPAPLLNWGQEMASGGNNPDFRDQWRDLTLKTIRNNEIHTIFMLRDWSNYSRRQSLGRYDEFFPTPPREGSGQGEENLSQDLKDTIRTLNRLGVRVVLVCGFPSQPTANSRNLRLTSRWPMLAPPPMDEATHRALNASFYRVLEDLPQTPGFTVVDPARIILGWSQLTLDHVPLYMDATHLSDRGAALLRPLFEPIFQTMKADASETGRPLEQDPPRSDGP